MVVSEWLTGGGFPQVRAVVNLMSSSLLMVRPST
jgi:hypothetical protein